MFLHHKECNVRGFYFWHHVSSGNLLDGRQAFGQVCVHLEKAKRFRFTCFSLIPYSYPRSDILFLIDKPQLVNWSKLAFLTANLIRWTPDYLDSGD